MSYDTMIYMEEKVFEYVFSRSDYDQLQQSFLTKDILGYSSWKGEERVVLYRDKIEKYINGALVEKHTLSEFESFYDGEWAETNNQVLLVKKIDNLTPMEKNIWPVIFGGGLINSNGRFNLLLKQSMVISFKNSDTRTQFCSTIESFLPRINNLNSQSYSYKNNMLRTDILWVLIILIIIVAVISFIYISM